MSSKWMCGNVMLSVEEGDALASAPAINRVESSFITSRVLVSETPPQAHFDVAKRWLDRCIHRHAICTSDVAGLPQLPARVINVTAEGQEPYLMDGNKRHASYASLSHCWGTSTVALTTKLTLQAHQNSLPLETLPKTFRDAIQVCRQLAIPHLWIDSLCIVQDDKVDWEQHSSRMGSIYHDSTLVIAATDSADSSKGLFLPRKPYEYCYADIITLPRSFGHDKGQVYVTKGEWGVSGPPVSDMENGILQSRGWAMQERSLAPRTLHFLSGQMVWECCDRILGQSGFKDSFRNSWRKNPRNQIKVFTAAFEKPYQLADSDDDGDDDDEDEDQERGLETVTDQTQITLDEVTKVEETSEKFVNEKVSEKSLEGGLTLATEADQRDDDSASEQSAYVTTLLSPDTRASTIIDLRDIQSQISARVTPTPISRAISNELYNFLDVASRQTIHHVWYDLVSSYSSRLLTFSNDKLPALAGIASRVQAITKDQYLAEHWRRELERSLFWRTSTMPNTWTPARVKNYRAPSWSWASIDGATTWSFADLAPWQDKPAPIEILHTTADVDGENSYGCVKAGKIIMKARVVTAVWNAENDGWTLPGTFFAFSNAQYDDLKLLSINECVQSNADRIVELNTNESGKVKDKQPILYTAGLWHYDDVINGTMPGPLPTDLDTTTDAEKPDRVVPSGYYLVTSSMNNVVHGKDFMETPRSQRGTYVPTELTLVKGPTRYSDEYDDEGERSGKVAEVDVLVLEKVEQKGEVAHRRVGVGQLRSWDEEVQSVEILTMI